MLVFMAGDVKDEKISLKRVFCCFSPEASVCWRLLLEPGDIRTTNSFLQ